MRAHTVSACLRLVGNDMVPEHRQSIEGAGFVHTELRVDVRQRLRYTFNFGIEQQKN